MQGATLSTQTTTDEGPGKQRNPAEAFTAMTLENSNIPGHHATFAETVEGAPALPPQYQQKPTSGGPSSNNNTRLTPPQIVTPTNPEAGLKPHGSKSVIEEFNEMKYNLQGVTLSMERLGIALIEANQLSAQEASVESIKQSIDDLLHTGKDRPVRNPFRARAPKTGGRKFPRPYSFRKTWSNKVTNEQTSSILLTRK